LSAEKQIDYALSRLGILERLHNDCDVIPKKSVAKQHRIVVIKIESFVNNPQRPKG